LLEVAMATTTTKDQQQASEFAAYTDAQADFAARLMRTDPRAGTRHETTAQRDMRERGTKRFNAYGCK